MPWNNQGGGPWNNTGGGGSGGPWGQRPGGSGGGGSPPPNLEEVLRRGQDRLRTAMPGGFGGRRGVFLLALALLLVWLASGTYRVNPEQQGVQLLFGKWDGTTTGPGLHWWAPRPIGEVLKPAVLRINKLDVGFAGGEGSSQTRDIPQESLMLTSDQNIADVDFAVLWRIGSAPDYLFNLRDPNNTVKAASESAMREIVGRTPLSTLLTEGRQNVEQAATELLQNMLEAYGAGVTVQQVQLLKVDAPPPVIDAFNEVQRARQDKELLQNQAEAYENRIVPTARGEASKIIEEATAYREQVTKAAEGEAEKFNQVYEAYLTAPEVTRRRMYLETMRQVIGGANKVILDQAGEPGSQGVVPYLPLNELRRAGSN